MQLEGISQEILRQVRARLNADEHETPRADLYIADVPRKLEHSLLNPDTTKAQILEGCRLAKEYDIAALCVAPYYVPFAAEQLYGSRVKVGSAVGFPHGCMSTEAKIAEIRTCTTNGAAELDVAINILAVKSGDMDAATRDLRACVDAAGGRATVKAVFEHKLFTDEEKKAVLEMIAASGAPYVKVQNVLSGHGARTEELALVRSVCGDALRIKIDGGVKTLEKAAELFAAGTDRIGLTATVSICKEAIACSRSSAE